MNVAGLILAAGKSERMGRPKPLLPFRGETFLDTLIGAMSASCSTVVVVLGHEADRIEQGLSRARQAVIVVNAGYEAGQLSSMQCGLRAMPSDIDAVAFTPVDYPAFFPETIARLCESMRQGDLLVVPRFEGRRGHPVIVHRDLIAGFLALPPESQAREVIHQHKDRTRYVDVSDPGILRDVDDPAAYQDLLQAYA